MEFTEEEFAKVPAVRKQAGLLRLADLLAALDALPGLKRQSPGIYRWRSRAFLHFHYHPTGEIVADVRAEVTGFTDTGDGWQRLDVSKRAGQCKLLRVVSELIEA